MPKYIYQPLEKPKSEFRLLQISKDPLTDQPQCTLQKYSLTTCPDYIALSYTWGEPTQTHSVAVDGANLDLRQNLFDFLCAYTIEPWGMDDVAKPVFYWIDQICINQEDPIERSDQVRIMSKIYKQANTVLVWLGCDPDMVDAAHRLRDAVYTDLSALATLLAHPYFTRIWIIQEIALSTKLPLMVCGGVELKNWDCLGSAGRFTERMIPAVPSIAIFGQRSWEKRTLDYCIRTHWRSNCQDPRDKVYGLLGLTPEKWRVRVDYTKEVLEVYFDAVAALFEELFDRNDPECFYPANWTIRPQDYRITLVALAKGMGFSRRQVNGVFSFFDYIEGTYLSTEIRNVQYTYTGRICTRVRAYLSSEKIPTPEEEFEVSWKSITATRRRPLMRDIIPEMGLQLASTNADSKADQSGLSAPALDRWWCKHDGEIHYFDCPDEAPVFYRLHPMYCHDESIDHP